MVFILITAALGASWLFKIGPLADISGWWVALAGLFTFAWCEYIEPMLGLDRNSKAIESLEKARQERVKKQFGRK